uniref:Uncharacterized protein n=1 Tax=Noctiluca scintillans TaxID=2966 RepID=A0A7S1A9N7_NOCSC
MLDAHVEIVTSLEVKEVDTVVYHAIIRREEALYDQNLAYENLSKLKVTFRDIHIQLDKRQQHWLMSQMLGTSEAAGNQETAALEAQKTELETSITEYSQSIARLKDELELIDKTMSNDTTSDPRLTYKRALVMLALDVDRGSTDSAVFLGNALLRTPAFFVSKGWSSFGKQQILPNTAGKEEAELPACPFDPAKHGWSDAFELIDRLTAEVPNLTQKPILELMSFLTLETLAPEIRQHLARKVTDMNAKASHAEANLRQRCHDPTIASSVVLMWPKDGDPTMAAYSQLNSHISDYCKSTNFEDPNNRTASRRTKSNDTSEEEREQLCRKALDSKYQHFFLSEMGAQAVTSEVVLVLQSIVRRGLHEVFMLQDTLMGSSSGKPWLRDQHWFARCKVVNTMSDLACHGNTVAANRFFENILHDSHWMIQQFAVVEACRIIRETTCVDTAKLYINEVVQIVLPASEQMPDSQVATVQQEAEKAILTQFPKFTPEKREYFIETLEKESRYGKNKELAMVIVQKILASNHRLMVTKTESHGMSLKQVRAKDVRLRPI